MSKLFTCDNCGKEFSQPLDEEMYKDIDGVIHVFDLCAPCRGSLKENRKKTEETYFQKILKKK